MNTELGREVVIAKAALYGLYERYREKREFSMDSFTSIERRLDNILALANGQRNTKSYPNPCDEVAIGGRGR